MKKSIFILSFFCFSAFHFSLVFAQQNIVPNYSFEQKIQCPTGGDAFNGYVADWTGQGSYGGGGFAILQPIVVQERLACLLMR